MYLLAKIGADTAEKEPSQGEWAGTKLRGARAADGAGSLRHRGDARRGAAATRPRLRISAGRLPARAARRELLHAKGVASTAEQWASDRIMTELLNDQNSVRILSEFENICQNSSEIVKLI